MRRLFWLGVGMVAGASGTVWAERKVRARVEALAPDHLVVVAADRARSVGRSVADAVSDGRDAMRDREAELRGERWPGGAAVHRGAPRSHPRSRPATWSDEAPRRR